MIRPLQNKCTNAAHSYTNQKVTDCFWIPTLEASLYRHSCITIFSLSCFLLDLSLIITLFILNGWKIVKISQCALVVRKILQNLALGEEMALPPWSAVGHGCLCIANSQNSAGIRICWQQAKLSHFWISKLYGVMTVCESMNATSMGIDGRCSDFIREEE